MEPPRCHERPLHHLRGRGGGMRVVEHGGRRAGALRRPGRRRGSRSTIALVDAGRRRGTALLVHAGVALALSGEARMRFVDEFRDAELGRALAGEILAAVEPGRHYKVMEVCGGHTHSIYKYGIDDLLPANVELVHGPGCPVCVIPMGRVDDGIAIAHEPGRDLHLLRRHDARARARTARLLDAKAAGRRRADGLLAARRAADRQARTPTARSCSSRSASRPPRPPPR